MDDNLTGLGVKAIRPSDEAVSETSIEDLPFDPPVELRNLLTSHNGFVAFDKWVVFKPDEPSGFEDERGDLHLTGIFGLITGRLGIQKASTSCAEQIPKDFYRIADSNGDHICLNDRTKQIYFCKHDSTKQPTLIAKSFREFLQLLVPREISIPAEALDDVRVEYSEEMVQKLKELKQGKD